MRNEEVAAIDYELERGGQLWASASKTKRDMVERVSPQSQEKRGMLQRLTR
jgi:hypothetical protein